jgi:hypothetical protein
MNAFQFGQMVKAALGPAQAGMAENVPAGYLDVSPPLRSLVANGEIKNTLAATPAGNDRFRGHRLNGIGGNNNSAIFAHDNQNFRHLYDGYQSLSDRFAEKPVLQYGDSRSFAPGAPRGLGSAARAATPTAAPTPAVPQANKLIGTPK